MFGYVDGGYDAVLRALRTHVTSLGVEIVTGAPVAAVEHEIAGVRLRFADGTVRTADAAVLTVPCPRVAALVPQLTDAERTRLRDVVYQGVVCPSLLLERPLATYYVTNITDGWVPFTGVIEMTTLVDPAIFGGRSLVYLPRYLAQDDPEWEKSDEELITESVAALERMYPAFRRDQVVATQVARVREVLAVTTLDYSRTLLPPLETSVPDVFIVNSAQIANGTLNVNETLALAARQAVTLAERLDRRRSTPATTPAASPIAAAVAP